MVSAACLALLSTSYSVSNADIVTVPLVNGLSVTVGTGSNASPLENLHTNPAATNVTMGDDSSVHVPLGFSFPYFGKSFTESWMYSNGAVNFLSGNAPNAFCCEGLNLATLKDPSYNYSIVPLWTDLIAIQGGSHYVLKTPTSVTYGWYGVSEYYDPSKRNTFELKIDSSGGLDVKFSGALVSYHNVTSGLIGDLSKGEYYQHHHGFGIQSGPMSFSVGGAPVVDPCTTDPLISPTCPGYAAALLKLAAPASIADPATAVADPASQTSTVSSSPSTTAVVEPQTQAVAVVSTAPASAPPPTTPSPTTGGTMPKVGEVSVAGGGGPRVSMSTIMSIVGAEQSRISGVERSVIQESISLATTAAQQAMTVGESTAAGATNTSMINALNSAVVGSSSVIAGSISQNLTVSSVKSAYSLDPQTTMLNTTQRSLQSSSTSIVQSITDTDITVREELKVGGHTVMGSLVEKTVVVEQPMQSQPSTSVRKDVRDNEAAGGVSISLIATQPVGYDSYFNAIKDVSFYAPKEVYANQRVIDNQRALRQLANDKLHQQLIEQQYSRGNQ